MYRPRLSQNGVTPLVSCYIENKVNPSPFNAAFSRTKDIYLWKTLLEKEKLL